MKKWVSLSAVAALTIVLFAVRPGHSDDGGKPVTVAQAVQAPNVTENTTTTEESPTPPKTTKRKEPRGRLPDYYGAIGVSNEQRDKIYTLQASYEVLIDELKRQMRELVDQRDAEIEAVLTENQKKALVNAREAGKQRALARARKAREARAAAQASTEAEADDK